MKELFSLVVHTANILGVFTDPFEFEGDYGPKVNPIRQKVFELVVSKEALSRNLTDPQIKDLLQNENANEHEIKNFREFLISQAIEIDSQHGPLISELVTPELIEELIDLQRSLESPSFTEEDLHKILDFLNHYNNQKAFRFLKNCPHELISLDKPLRDSASREGRSFDLSILSSTQFLKGKNSDELKRNLLFEVFDEKTLNLTKPGASLEKSLSKSDGNYLKQFFGENADNHDLQAFYSPAGQTFFYWLYHALNLHLISTDPQLIEQVNEVKNIFRQYSWRPKSKSCELYGKSNGSRLSSGVYTRKRYFCPPSLDKRRIRFCLSINKILVMAFLFFFAAIYGNLIMK